MKTFTENDLITWSNRDKQKSVKSTISHTASEDFKMQL